MDRFVGLKSSLIVTVLGVAILVGWPCNNAAVQSEVSEGDFAREVERILPEVKLYDYHRQLSEGSVHVQNRRNPDARLEEGEMALPDEGWVLIWRSDNPSFLQTAAEDFQDYLDRSMGVKVRVEAQASLDNWQSLSKSIVVGTRDQLPGCGIELRAAKDYEIIVTSDRWTVCGFDARGAMFGLYNLEARMNLREAPFLPSDLKVVRHSLYDTRMVLSWMGWMEWPDQVLSHLVHDGFDAIFAPVYANPNGDRRTAESSTDFYARLMYRVREVDPSMTRDLINRASRYGIKVYAQIIYQYLGTPESEAQLRKLVREILKEFPDIQGYILLTEGFWYGKWGGGRGDDNEVRAWAQNWSQAVGIVAEECRRVNPEIEILPWDYNIDFRPEKADLKRYVIQQLPDDTIPLLTWENGKSFEIDGLRGHVRDYSISQVGPSEVTRAQIEEARRRNMKVYTNADTFFCGGQLQTIPYHPFPHQWYQRYKAMEEYGIDGTLESWSTGYAPNFMTELRAWTCWSNAPPFEELLEAVATRSFGEDGKEMALQAWELFSQAIRLLPDTGPTMGTSNATGNPLFLQEPPARTTTFYYSWTDHEKWMGYMGGKINPYWPFTLARLVFYPDFTNQTNKAELYARAVSGVAVTGDKPVLPVFLKYLRLAAEKMDKGLKLYRAAALKAPPSKREDAIRQAMMAEQLERMLMSEHALLEFENLRTRLATGKERGNEKEALDRMEAILREEITRTQLSLLATTRDSRVGFQFECDYVFTPYSLREKLESLNETLEVHLPEWRRQFAAY